MFGQLLLALVVAYWLGSFPSAFILTHHLRQVDIRTLGDGNPGGKNVFHHVSPLAGVIVTLLDIGKGTIAILFARTLELDSVAILWVGIAAIAGHNWSVFLHWRGGQGMATTVGVLFALMPAQTLAAILTIVLSLLIVRNWDMACGIGFASLPIMEWWTRCSQELILYTIMLLPLIGIRKWMQQDSRFPGTITSRLHRLH